MTIFSLFVVLVTLSMSVVPAYAQSDNQGFSFAKPDFVFQITNIIEDIRLGFAIGQDKIELIKEFALDKQTRIDEALSRGETVSLAVEERRNDILDKVSTFDATRYCDELDTVAYTCDSLGNNNPFFKIKNDINQLAEYNEIRILFSQFDECTTQCSEIEKEQFNEKVNSLDTWQNKCSGSFDIHDYALTDSSFDRLSNVCPDLNKYSKNHLITALSGKT